MRRNIIAILTLLAVLVGVGVVGAARGGGSTVTRARLERALPAVFANIWVNQAQILGHKNVTVASLDATAMCDKHGPDVADIGPGGDWICLMTWNDPNVPMPKEGYGKFDLNVHSNDCFTAAGQTKLTGFLTITDTRGDEVTNPAFEFDGCFDPNGDNSPTGVRFPSVFNSTSTTVTPDTQGHVSINVTCGTGSQGCAGSATATAGAVNLGTVSYTFKEEATSTLSFPQPLPPDATSIDVDIQMATGVAGSKSVTIPVQTG